MNHSFLVKNYLVENERRVNSIIRWFPIAFLILCPMVLIAGQSGMLPFDVSVGIRICIGLVVICVFPVIFSRYSYHESWSRCVSLTVIEILVCLLSCSDVANVSLLYALVPLIALLYVEPEIFIHTARNCFIAMVIVEIGLFVYRYQEAIKTDGVYQADYLGFLTLLLEYVIFMFALYFLLQHFQEMIFSL